MSCPLRILSLELNNFRQYRGKVVIRFPVDDKKRIVVIEGNNGTGKTNLLNAITWCLYGEELHLASTTKIDPLNIREQRESSKSLLEMSVTIVLGHEKPLYKIERKRTYTNIEGQIQSEGKDEFNVLSLRDGNWKLEGAPSDFINILLPRSIHDFYFFDGEKLDNLFRTERKKNIQDSIINIAQIDLLERLIDHLDKFKREIRNKELRNGLDNKIDKLKEIDKLSGEIDKLSGEIDKLSGEIDREKDNLKTIDNTIKEKEAEFEKIDKEFISMNVEYVRKLSEERGKLTQQRNTKHNELKQKKEELKDYIAQNAPFIYVSEAITKINSAIEEMEVKGQLPPKIASQFIKELLEKGVCICGTPIDNNNIRQHLERYMESMKNTTIINEIIRTNRYNVLPDIKKQISLFHDQIDTYKENIRSIEDKIGEIESRLKDISVSLQQVDNEEIRKKEEERNKLNESLRQLREERGRIESYLENKKSEKDEKEKELNQLLASQEKYKKIKSKLDLCDRCIEESERIKKELLDEIKKGITQKMNKYFLSLIWKKDTFESISINDDYDISVFHKDGKDIISSLSAGEREVLALSYIAALRDVVKIYMPIIMDTPLARISGEPRENIAALFPNYLQDTQIILLLTDQEYTPVVKEKLKPYLAKEYRLEFDEDKQQTRVIDTDE